MPIIVLPLRRGAFFHVSDAGVYALKCALAAARCIFLCIGCVCLWPELRSRCCAVHFLWLSDVCNGWLAPAGRDFSIILWPFFHYVLLCETLSIVASRGLGPGPGVWLVGLY